MNPFPPLTPRLYQSGMNPHAPSFTPLTFPTADILGAGWADTTDVSSTQTRISPRSERLPSSKEFSPALGFVEEKNALNPNAPVFTMEKCYPMRHDSASSLRGK